MTTRALVSVRSDAEPGESYIYDREKKFTLQYRVREKIPREHIATMKPVRYPSATG